MSDTKKAPKIRKIRRDCKQVLWMKEQLGWWCKDKGFELLTEYQFHEYRKFRFDFAIREIMVAIEYEGIISEKSGHTSNVGYTKNADKYNLAQIEGWFVLRYTTVEQHYKNVTRDVEKMMSQQTK